MNLTTFSLGSFADIPQGVSMKTTLKITGMTCQNCVRHVREALEGVSGVSAVTVDLDSGLATVEQSPFDTDSLIDAVAENGYRAELQNE